jgi:hypothetical protein
LDDIGQLETDGYTIAAMDGYRQTLLGRALADALQELEQERGEDDEEVDGDLLFSLFDEAMKLELRDRRDKEHWTFTHETLELSGQVTAFNRFMEDWSLQALHTRSS